jgi:hypothetical protein
MRQMLKRRLQDAGLPHLFSPHSFRVAVVTGYYDSDFRFDPGRRGRLLIIIKKAFAWGSGVRVSSWMPAGACGTTALWDQVRGLSMLSSSARALAVPPTGLPAQRLARLRGVNAGSVPRRVAKGTQTYRNCQPSLASIDYKT